MSVGSIQAGAGSATASALRATEDNPAVAMKMLKKSMEGERDIVNTLLAPAALSTGLDIRA